MTLNFHLFLFVLISQKACLYQIFFFNLTQISFIFQDSSHVFCLASTISLHMTEETPPLLYLSVINNFVCFSQLKV